MQLSFAGKGIFLRGEALKDDTVFEHKLSVGTLHAIFLSPDASLTDSGWLSRLLLRRLELRYVVLLLISASSLCCSFTITVNLVLKLLMLIISCLFHNAQVKLFFVVFSVVDGVWLFCYAF